MKVALEENATLKEEKRSLVHLIVEHIYFFHSESSMSIIMFFFIAMRLIFIKCILSSKLSENFT